MYSYRNILRNREALTLTTPLTDFPGKIKTEAEEHVGDHGNIRENAQVVNNPQETKVYHLV